MHGKSKRRRDGWYHSYEGKKFKKLDDIIAMKDRGTSGRDNSHAKEEKAWTWLLPCEWRKKTWSKILPCWEDKG